jgi:molybdopterin converting factor small subunit
MKVRVQFFSHLKDVVPSGELEVELAAGAKVDDLLGQLYAENPKLRAWDSSILVGAGLEFVERDHSLRPNEEISIMPPLQGG